MVVQSASHGCFGGVASGSIGAITDFVEKFGTDVHCVDIAGSVPEEIIAVNFFPKITPILLPIAVDPIHIVFY